MPEDAPVVESMDSEAAPSESSPVPSASASETSAETSSDKSQAQGISDLLSGSSALSATNGEKPEAFLIHFKPKAGQTSKSKYMLLLKLPDGSTETIEANSETLAPEASQTAKSVPSVEESSRNIQQTTQNQFDDEIGFDDEPQRGGSASAAGAAASGGRFGGSSSASAGASAGGSFSSVSATASAGGSTATVEQQLQSDDEQQQQDDADQPQQQPQDTQQQVSDDDTQQQQAFDDQTIDQQIEQQKVEQERDGGSSASADPTGSGYGQQPQQNPLAGLTSSPNSGAVYTSYAGIADQQVPVILIALPPRASAQSQKQTLNRLLGALRGQSAQSAGVKGRQRAAAAPAAGARKGGSLQNLNQLQNLRGGKTSPPAPQAPTKGGRPAANPAAQQQLSGTKGGAQVSGGSLRLGPLSPVAQLAAKGGAAAIRVKGTRGQGNTNSPENPQPRHPTGGFGGYGNSHTPSPSGGYGSLAMRLAAKGIPLPNERDMQRPAAVKAAILSLARQPANANAPSAGRKSTRLTVRNY